MKKILSIVTVFVMSFCFIMNVNAAEASLSSIASINSSIGGSDTEIVQVDSDANYNFYYKYVAIDSTEFNKYVGARYIVDNSDSSSDEYTLASSQIAEYANNFKALIPEVASSSELESWTLATGGEINLSDLTYQESAHNGYVIAIATVIDDDPNIYIERLILESTSTSTLGSITYISSDDALYGDGLSSSDETVSTDSNPNTGLSDYAIYLVPVSIVLGSFLLLRRSAA